MQTFGTRRAAPDRSTDHVVGPSFFAGRKADVNLAYGQAKLLAILWMAYLARQYPDRRFVSVSPGNTTGTHAPDDLALPFRMAAKYVMPHLGISHKLDVGAKRLVDGVTDATLSSGVFYASAAGKMKGPVVNQTDISPNWPTRRFRTTPTKPSTASSPQRQSRNTSPAGFQRFGCELGAEMRYVAEVTAVKRRTYSPHDHERFDQPARRAFMSDPHPRGVAEALRTCGCRS